MQPDTQKKLKCAVIGVGYLGRFHAEKYKNSPHAELYGVCDRDSGRAQELAQKLNCLAFSDHQELLKKVDAVTIATPTQSHFTLAYDFLSHGVHVNLEKPMTATISEGEQLVELAQKNNLVLQVGHVERFNPALIEAKEKLGQPLFIECHRLAPFKPRGTDVDVVLDLMIHDLDVILSLVKSPLKSVQAVGIEVLTKTTDIANARLEFESGAVANVTSSRVSQSSTRKFRVFQHNQYLSIDFGTGEVNLTTKTGEITDLESMENLSPEELPLKFDSWNLEKGDALQRETDSFLMSVIQGTPPLVSGADGLRALRAAEKVRESIFESTKNINSSC